MKRKTYYEKAVSLIDELNRNGNGELEVFSCNNTSELSYTDKKRKKGSRKLSYRQGTLADFMRYCELSQINLVSTNSYMN